ncbi:MAG: hypothetical protein KDE19_25285 [Caldilineaceae bacterium]|nr:hypothetical protein [Caldilineaceae bacterium]
MSKRQPFKMRSLRKRIAEHQQKILEQEQLAYPDEGFINHWQQEIRAFTIQLERLDNRIARRRGR